MLPPGRARLAMKPAAIGSPTAAMRNGLGCLASGVRGLGSRRQDDVDVSLGKVGGEGGQAISLPLRVTKLKPNVPSIRPPSVLKRRRECADASFRLRKIGRASCRDRV